MGDLSPDKCGTGKVEKGCDELADFSYKKKCLRAWILIYVCCEALGVVGDIMKVIWAFKGLFGGMDKINA